MRKTLRCWMTVQRSRPSLLRVESLDNLSLENAYRSRPHGRSYAKAFDLSKRIWNQARRIAQGEDSRNLAHRLTRTGPLWLRRDLIELADKHGLVATSAPRLRDHCFYRTRTSPNLVG